MKTRVIGYVRVSTDQQAESGLSLDAQQSKLRQYAELYDLEIVEMIVDAGESAASLKRPGLQRALSLLDRGGNADGLLIAKIDRLTRSVKDLGHLLDKYFSKYALMSVAEAFDTRTPTGRMILNIMASVSQWEREECAVRTRTALQAKKARGERLGRAPMAGPVVDRIRVLRASGMPYRQIAAIVASEGYQTALGGSWAPETVRLIAQRAA